MHLHASRSVSVVDTRVLKNRPLMLAMGANLVLFFATYLVWTPGFQSNDDPMMMLLTAGVGRTVEPSLYLGFSHVIVGWMLKHLYALTIHVPWYAFYLIGGLFAAHSTLLFLVLERTQRLSALLLYLVYFLMVGVDLLLNLQFTVTSGL